MSQPASGAPPSMLPSPFFHEEVSIIAGIVIESLFYGIAFVLYCLTIRNLLRRRESNKHAPTLYTLMGFLTVQQIAILIAITCNIQFGVLAFVNHRDTLGGPVAYQIMNSNIPVSYASLASFVVSNWLQDVVLLYRFLVIYNRWYKTFAATCVLFMTSMAFSLILLIQLSGHAGLLNVGNNLPTSTIYFSLSVGLNVIVTLLIVGRIIYCARMTTINRSRLPKHYVSVTAMILESAALSSLTGIALIITLNTNFVSPIAFESLYGLMTVLSPVLITYRVSTGEAWDRCTLIEQSQGTGSAIVISSGPSGSRTVLGSTGASGEEIMMKGREGGFESYSKSSQSDV